MKFANARSSTGNSEYAGANVGHPSNSRSAVRHGLQAVVSLLSLCFILFVCGAQAAEQTRFPDVETLVQQGHLDEAETEMRKRIQQHPSVEGYNLLGIIESERQEFPDAIAAFQEALQLSPNSAQTHNNLGNVNVAQKKFELAEKEFRTALRLEPANRDANYNLGVLLMARGAPAEAISHLERVRPASLETSLNLVHAYLESKRTGEALRMAAELSQQHTAADEARWTSTGLNRSWHRRRRRPRPQTSP